MLLLAQWINKRKITFFKYAKLLIFDSKWSKTSYFLRFLLIFLNFSGAGHKPA